MQGLELLFDAMVGDVFTVKTAYAVYPSLIFMGFHQENDDVTLAAFNGVDITQGLIFFDISVPSNQVIVNQ
jgi:hypothetical protein